MFSSTKNPSLAAAASWLTMGKTVAFVVTFALPLIMVRHLSQEDFGVYRQLFLLVNTVMVALPFGFVMSAFYFLPRVQNHRSVALNIVLVYGVLAALAGVVLIVRPTLLGEIFSQPSLVVYARQVAAILFLATISSVIDMLALANGDVATATIFIIITNVTKTVLLGGAAIVFRSVHAILYASMVHGVLQVILLIAYLNRRFASGRQGIDLELLRRQLAYALPFGLAYWLYWLQTESHQYFVARSFNSATYAIYSVGCASLPLLFAFRESTCSLLIHRVSQLHSEKRGREIVEVLSQAVRNLTGVYLPIYVLLMLIGRDLIAIVYTPKFLASWPIFAVNLSFVPFGILATITDAVVRSYTECRTFFIGVQITLVPLLLTGLWFLTPRYGPVAAISLVIATIFIERIIVGVRIARALELKRSDAVLFKDVITIVANALAAGAVTFVVRAAVAGLPRLISVAICVVVFAAVYLTIFVLRLLMLGQEIDLPLGILPKPVQQRFAVLLARTRGVSESDGSGSKAA